MSYADGWAAINLEMPDRVPRCEYSAHMHWDLVNRVCGTDITPQSSKEEKQTASSAFVKAWNYDFMWTVLTHCQELGKWYTNMGHAAYATGGTDYNNNIHCPFEDEDEALNFDPMTQLPQKSKEQMIKEFEAHYASQVEKYPGCVNVTGTYITCISGLIEIFGWDLLLTAAAIDPNKFGELTNRYCEWMSRYFVALAESKVPLIKVHDDIVWTNGAFIHPDWYRKFVFPNYKKMFAPVYEAGKKIIFTSDGTYTEFIDDIADCGVSGFVMEPTTDMQEIADKYGKTHSFIGNADCRILTSGTKDDIYNEVKRCMDIGKKYPGFFMAVGNHIPSNVPVENALWYNECYEKLGKR